MSFSIPTIQESAETPELGGEFGDLILIIKPYLSAEQKQEARKYWETEWDKKSHIKQPVYNSLAYIENLDNILSSLIIGWKNCEQEFNEENKSLLLRLADELTSQDIEEDEKDKDGELTGEKKIRKARLGEYVMKFASDSTNFKKKLKNT
jgi:hypothetical protein